MSTTDCRVSIENEDLMFSSNKPWWLKHRWLRRMNYLALVATDGNYEKWKKSRISRRRYLKMLDKLDKSYSPEKFSMKKLIGREKELNLILDAFRFHVLRHPKFLKWFGKEGLPKAFCITGESGAGKTFIAMVGLRQMILEANLNGLQVSPVVIRGSDVYSEFYGKSTKQLASLLKQASVAPSVIYIDEFQSFGRKVRGETSAEMEDTRVQDELNRWLDNVLSNDSRTLVIMATNAYETTREDIRRRLVRINLDAGMTRDMLLAIVSTNLEKYGWNRLSSEQVLKMLERHAAIRRKGSVTPNDITNVFKEVKRRKDETLRNNCGANGSFDLEKSDMPSYEVLLEDFEAAASVMKFYSDQQKSQQVTDAVCVEKPDRKRSDIGGLNDVKNKLLNQIALALNPKMSALGQRANNRFMLLGPPGTGKTLLTLVAAAENDVPFIRVRGGELMSGATYQGEPEKRITDLFALARQKSPCILFLDEADAIFWGADPASNKVLAQVKAELSDLESRDRIVVIAASNKEQLIDPATRDRFEPNIYYIHPPLNDSDWKEVVEIHLRTCKNYLDKEVDASKITSLLMRQRAMSPRGIAETIAEAHRLWASELSAAWELVTAKKAENSTKVREVLAKYGEDFGRLCSTLGISSSASELDGEKLSPETYKIRLSHFVTAIENLESLEDKNRREAEEALICINPPAGVSHGLYTTDRGDGGILAIQCSVRPTIQGENRISVTGQATSVILGQVSVPDYSVVQSAENAIEAAASWLWEKSGINLAAFHVHFQIRSLLEGAPGQGVSGPSAGFAMFAALISELSKEPISGSKVMTGTIGVKLDVGPVGGLGGSGRERGKLVGILKSQKLRVTDLFLPESNCRSSSDEMQMLRDEGLIIHPMAKVDAAICQLLGVSETNLLGKIRDLFQAKRYGEAALTARLV